MVSVRNKKKLSLKLTPNTPSYLELCNLCCLLSWHFNEKGKNLPSTKANYFSSEFSLVGYFGFNRCKRQYSSQYIEPSPREEKKEKKDDSEKC